MKKMQGFSLAEMMIVLLIVSIVAAFAAPMVNNKMLNDIAERSPWVWADSNNIAYNLNNDNRTATIGTVAPPNGASARLFIQSDANTPHLAFGDADGRVLNFIANASRLLLTNNANQAQNVMNSVAFGPNTRSVNNAVAIGSNVNTLGANSVSVGTNVNDNSQNANAQSIAIGAFNSVGGARAIAIGSGFSSDNFQRITANADSVAIGSGTTVGNSTIRTSANANSVAIGAGARTTAAGAIALGYNSRADRGGVVAIGNNVNTGYSGESTDNSVVIGSGAQAFAQNTTAIGGPTLVNGQTRSAQATAQNATAYGAGALASQQNAVAIGCAARATSRNSIAIGQNATANTTTSMAGDAIAIGNSSNARQNSIAIGSGAQATVTNAIALGTNASATRDNTIVLGNANSTVHIRGNLVVGGAVAANDLYSNSYLIVYGNKQGFFRRSDLSDWKWRTPELWDTGDALDKGKIYTKDDSKIKDLAGPTIWRNFYEGYSDRRLKNVGEAFKGGLEEIKKLEVFNYTYKKDAEKTPHVGVIAQDLQKIFPDAVFKGEDGFLRIRMEDMFYAVVNAVKELAEKITAHDKKIEELTKQNQELLEIIDKLEKQIDELEK